MDEIKGGTGNAVKKKSGKKKRSVKWSFILYVPVCILLAYAGTALIGHGSNYLQYKYDGIYWGENNFVQRPILYKLGFWFVSYAQVFLIPLWVLFSAFLTGTVFYKRELEKPVKILLDASEKIADNRLDFQISCEKNNEIGALCDSFEKMRAALYQSNKEIWRMLEERKEINAAFAHEMRTPITVLKGYRDLLEKFIPGGAVSEEKIMDILQMMKGQIDRLEIHTQKMSAMQKLEDIVPAPAEIQVKVLMDKCSKIGNMLGNKLQIDYLYNAQDFCSVPDGETIRADEGLFLEVFENLVSNAARFAADRLRIAVCLQYLQDGMPHTAQYLTVSVEDDGPGFSKEALVYAAKPFYASGPEEGNHFGLGLYLCSVICEKCGGELKIENGKQGGKVTASFKI